MKRFILLLLLMSQMMYSQTKKEKLTELMQDNSVNFYDVVDFAEKNYTQELKKTKGAGWKPFLRWKNENEYKFYPSGNRNQVNFDKIYDNYQKIKASSANTQKTIFNNGWEELGPIAAGQITGHYSFGMGRIVSFYINPSNTDQMYLGSRTGGFWKTTNGGTSWSGGATDFLPASGVNAIAVKPTAPNNGKVLINVNNSNNHYTHGIYESTDGGDTFTESTFNPTNLGWGGLGSNREIYKIKYHPTVANLVFIGTRVGLYRSTDDLATTNWTIPVSGDDFTDIDFHPTDPTIIYAYAKNNPNVIYVSNDAGVTFSTVEISGNNGSVGTVQVSPDCPNCVYYFSNNGYWKSTNKGFSFSMISNPGLSDDGFAVSDLDDNNILAGYLDGHFSTDGGNNFNQVTYWSLGNTNGEHSSHQNSYNTSTDYIHADIQTAECLNGIFYACTDGFLVKSINNGQDWDILSEDGVGIRMNYNLGVSQSNHDRVICGSQDNGVSIKTENGWVEMYGADGMEGIIHPLNDDWMIGSSQNGGRIKTTDAGQTENVITPNGGNDYWIAPMFYDPNDHMTVYHLGENIMKSTDFGETWVTLGTPSFTNDIQFATIAENNSNIIVVTRYENIELSEDGGNTFTDITGTLPYDYITDVVFDPNDDDTIIVTYGYYPDDGNKVFITHDRGATWSNITYNLNNMPILSVVIDHTDNSNIYLGAEIGIYKMAMGETTWTLYNTDLPNVAVKEMEIVYGSNTLRASTWGRGLWEFAINGRQDYPSIVSTTINNLPTNFSPKESLDQFVTSEILYDNTLTNAYVKWSTNNPTFENTIVMNNVSGDIWESDTPLPNYPEGTKMYFKVFAEGDSGDVTETYKFVYTVKEFAVCDAFGTNSAGNLYINQVSLENISNSSNNDAYTYYSDQIANLERGETYTITVNANTSWSDNDYGVWIDFNADADFNNEELILSSIDPNSNTAISSFTVPLDAKLTNVRMRVRLGYWDSPVLDPCGSSFGEVEDYLVNITGQTLSNTDVDTLSKIKIFPNPFNNEITIDTSNRRGRFTLVDITGKIIFSGSLIETGKTKYKLPQLAQGLYLLKVSLEDGSQQIIKLIKE